MANVQQIFLCLQPEHTSKSNRYIKIMNSLLHCPASFSGAYNRQEIQQFIKFIKAYKDVKCITDEQALLEFNYILTDNAFRWWLKTKSTISTWSEALYALKNQYSNERPNHVIYSNMFELSRKDRNNMDDIIGDQYELMEELTNVPLVNEQHKLEFIYGMLPNRLQTMTKFTATSLDAFKENIRKENNGLDKTEVQTEPTETNVAFSYKRQDQDCNVSKHQQQLSEPLHSVIADTANTENHQNIQIISVRSAVDIFEDYQNIQRKEVVNSNENPGNSNKKNRNKRPRCKFCRGRTHTVERCLKLIARNLKRQLSQETEKNKKGETGY